jgi:hypothetical protein
MSESNNGSNSNGTLFSGLPWWLRGMAVVGFPAVAAIYLTWLVGQALPSKVEAVQNKVNDVYSLEYQHNVVFLEKWSAQEQAQRELVTITRALCVNSAKDEVARNRCLGR